MKVKITSEEELVGKFREAIHVLENMRKFQKLWDGNYGVNLRERKKYWEGKADSFLSDLENVTINIKS